MSAVAHVAAAHVAAAHVAAAHVAAPDRPKQDPSVVIQRAWSVFRLPRLQELIVATIDELRFGSCPGLPGAQSGSARPATPDPSVEAFQACCDELREESGMPGAGAERAQHVAAIRRYMREEPLDWSTAFAQALGTYREAAAHAMERTFARASAA